VRRLGLMGGTFDPIHLGHLDVARAAADALALEEVRLIPSFVPPHRAAPGASAFHRFAMASLAAASHKRFTASDEELLRGGASYTAETLRALHAAGFAPGELFFLTGADAFAEIATWRDYPALLDLSHFVVCSRPGHEADMVRGLLPELAERMVDGHEFDAAVTAPRIVLLDADTANVSSSGVRRAIAAGQAIDGMVLPSVAAHIRKHGLYNARQHGSIH
jgi:nicotinate-nucleotide adenylyltransferase